MYSTASSSSCTSSVGNLGSPKPEKRQANSPLPPTPKNSTHLSNSNLTSSSSATSGRNSAASVIECPIGGTSVGLTTTGRHVSRENLAIDQSGNKKIGISSSGDDADLSKKKNPSKNLEGMYAKVNIHFFALNKKIYDQHYFRI